MPRYKVMATVRYKDAYVDAKNAEEAVQIAENSNNFITVGDFQIHTDMTQRKRMNIILLIRLVRDIFCLLCWGQLIWPPAIP